MILKHFNCKQLDGRNDSILSHIAIFSSFSDILTFYFNSSVISHPSRTFALPHHPLFRTSRLIKMARLCLTSIISAGKLFN